jgi:hypothetical protein
MACAFVGTGAKDEAARVRTWTKGFPERSAIKVRGAGLPLPDDTGWTRWILDPGAAAAQRECAWHGGVCDDDLEWG